MVRAPGLSGGAGDGLRGGPGPGPKRGGRGRGAAATCPAHSARGRAGDAGGCAGPRPAATIPPAALAGESRGCLGGSRLGTAPAGGSGPGRGGLRAGAATSAPGRATTLCPPPPPLPFLPPARQAPLSSLLSPPLLPLPSPRLAATRSVYGGAGRGGASSGPGQLRPARGPAWDAEPGAPRWKSLLERLRGGQVSREALAVLS